jgi:hypothetical protein
MNEDCAVTVENNIQETVQRSISSKVNVQFHYLSFFVMFLKMQTL